MKKSLGILLLTLFFGNGVFAQVNLPEWPIVPQPYGNDGTNPLNQRNAQRLRMNTAIPHNVVQIPNTSSVNAGPAQAGFDRCGRMIFYVLHDGTNAQNHLNIFLANGTELLGQSVNPPGLNGYYSDQEMQVVLSPGTTNEWYIIYNRHNACLYEPSNVLFTKIRIVGGTLTVIGPRDQVLAVNGTANTYSYGKALSLINNAGTQHFLYLYRRTSNAANADYNRFYIDRFTVSTTGIAYNSSTNAVSDNYWGNCNGAGTVSGSPIEISNDGARIAVNSRKQDQSANIYLFQTNNFSGSNPTQIIGLSGLTIVSATNQQYLSNWSQKIGCIEFSPNGQFLYLTGGGFVDGNYSNLTYLGQINLNSLNSGVRLQVQTTPNFSAVTGRGNNWPNAQDPNYLSSHMLISIEKSFDGNLYFNKTNTDTLFVLPNPNGLLPINLTPHDVNFGTAAVPNIPVQGYPNLLPDQIDGHNYLAGNVNVVASSPNFTPCLGSSPFQLTGTPAGGTWSGSPLVSSSGMFTPSAAGTYTISYTAQRCQDNITIQVVDCPDFCCPYLVNLILNPEMNQPLLPSSSSQYRLDAAAAPSSTEPGEYILANGTAASKICSKWIVQDHSSCNASTGQFMIVNGETTQASNANNIIWQQTVSGLRRDSTYKFCAHFKNLPACCFDVLPKVRIEITPGVSPVTATINTTTGACDWQQVSLTFQASATSVVIRIYLEETAPGDGNDLAIDDISLHMLPRPSYVVSATTQSNQVWGSIYSILNTDDVLPSPECKYFWIVGKYNPATQTIQPPIMTGNNSNGWGLTTNFPGYSFPNGTPQNPNYYITLMRIYDCNCFTRKDAYAVVLNSGAQFKIQKQSDLRYPAIVEQKLVEQIDQIIKNGN